MPQPIIKRICVFCGSRPGSRPEYLEAARELGRQLAERQIGLVYGGASVGMMGALANAVL
jgi:predicted Rossmann-fold nucleotide-binding protein